MSLGVKIKNKSLFTQEGTVFITVVVLIMSDDGFSAEEDDEFQNDENDEWEKTPEDEEQDVVNPLHRAQTIYVRPCNMLCFIYPSTALCHSTSQLHSFCTGHPGI